MQQPPTPTFEDLLAQHGLRTSIFGQHVEVHGDLDLGTLPIQNLPPELTVRGRFFMHNTHVRHLPDKLVVEGALFLNNALVRALPKSLSVGTDLILSHSHIMSLPPGLHVRGRLDLSGTPLRTLPPGLRVDENLDLSGVLLARLPPDLRVQGMILPPTSLEDLEAFMAKHAGDAVFHPPASAHTGMELRARLTPYPDLLAVVLALNEDFYLVIQKFSSEWCRPSIEG